MTATPDVARAAVVAGGGRGIGRACSLALASSGARVLVVDPGVSPDGGGDDDSVAFAVADEITSLGGTALGAADAIGSFADGERIISRCVAEFGSVDSVLAPAGILRDRMVYNLSEDDWRAVVEVNLSAVFGLVRAACIQMRRQRSGRIVTFTSAAGLEGRAGTSNYAAAKAGIVGLTKGVARDMEQYGVRVNCIAPRANTRLTRHVQASGSPGAGARFDAETLGAPEDVARLAAYLASELCRTSGSVFFCGEGKIGIYAAFIPAQVVAADGVTVDEIARLVDELLE